MISGIVDALISQQERLSCLEESELVTDLYDLLHLRRPRRATPKGVISRPMKAEDIFGLQIRQEKGWHRAAKKRSGSLVFEREGLHITVSEDDVTDDGHLLLPAIRNRYTPGFAALLSTEEPPENGTRIYLPVERERVPHVGHLLSKVLPRISDRFVVKVLTDPNEYPRPDSFTIFVSNEVRETTLTALDLSEIQKCLDIELGSSLFAREEQRGIAWMEGSAATSAGEDRAKCVARAVLNRPDWEPDALARSLENEFRMAGIDPYSPHRLLHVEAPNGN